MGPRVSFPAPPPALLATWKVELPVRVTFACRSGFSVDLVAKAVHCYRMADGAQNRFISGWEFMAGSADKTAVAIGKLIEAADD